MPGLKYSCILLHTIYVRIYRKHMRRPNIRPAGVGERLRICVTHL